MEHTRDSQKLLLDQWKYRHGMLYKTLHRYAWFWIVLALLPSVASVAADSKKLKDFSPQIADLFRGVRQPGSARCVYWGLVLLFFVGCNLHLAAEHRYLKGVEDGMATEFRPSKGRVAWWPYILWSAGWLFFFACLFFNIFR